MSNEITPEIISDEQLEEVAGGLADVENNSCVALLPSHGPDQPVITFQPQLQPSLFP